MQVLLLKDVRGVGTKDSIKEVADGYALNFLIAKGLAVHATKEKIAEAARRAATAQQRAADGRGALAASLKALNGRTIHVRAKANAQGHLFKGLGAKDIATVLSKEAGTPIEADAIGAEGAVIKSVGDHAVHVQTAAGEAAVVLRVEAEG